MDMKIQGIIVTFGIITVMIIILYCGLKYAQNQIAKGDKENEN